uniref:Uncharacterized protein n=1 Tax=viral metagenome TaxID=1070528 RepID=A0A6M3LSH4_9ZZZZ
MRDVRIMAGISSVGGKEMDKIINNIHGAIRNGIEKARLNAIDDISIAEVLDVIAEVYSEDHTLIIDVAGPCGIEDFSGKVEIDFNNLEELYQWAERKKSAS